MAQLSDEAFSEITRLCKEGDALFDAGQLEDAKSRYFEALGLVPEPRYHWEAATWIYVAIGDVHFKLGNFEKCYRCFLNAVQCPGGLGNPFIHLRLGQAYFEKDDMDKAADELARAYMSEGPEIFDEDDPKYLDFLKTRIKT